MDISSIYKSLHGMLDEDKLIPVSLLPSNVLSNSLEIDLEDLKVLNNEIDLYNIYFNPKGGLYPFCYWDGLLYFPLVTLKKEVLFTEDNSLIIKSLKFQLERLNTLLEEDEWEDLFSFVDKKVTFLVFERLINDIPENMTKKLFLDIYQRNEYGFDRLDIDMVRYVLSLEVPKEYDISTVNVDEDTDGYCKVYRGSTDKSTDVENAYSWTLDYNIACFFANRHTSSGTIYIGKVKKEDIKAYIDGRGEKEVIVFFEDVIIDDVEVLNS